METIKQAKNQITSYYQDFIDKCIDVHGIDLTTIINDCVTAGVNAAQQWISIEKELPDAGRTVLVKDKNNHIGLSCIRHGSWDYKFANTITHWRLIEIK